MKNRIYEKLKIIKSKFLALTFRNKIIISTTSTILFSIIIAAAVPSKKSKQYYNYQNSYNNYSDYSEETNEWDDYSCDDALSKCKSECGDVSLVHPDSGESIYSSDFESNCEDACRSGYRSCEGEKNEYMCDDFRSSCKNNCPTSVYDYESGDTIYPYEAEDGCEEACKNGANDCEY